jgi:GT2 family glycosyltransferase
MGHIDEIVFHRPIDWADDLDQFEKSGKELLQAHLWRQGIFAEVNLGLIKGSFFVDYPLIYSPLISIIIPTKDHFDLLQPCVESLLEKTGYSNYEVIIVDNLSSDPATLEYLAQLSTRDQRIKVIPYPQAYNYSAINNLAAQKAKGDYLLLLNNDTVIIQDNWLERLIAIGLRQDVGVVGCRLVYVDQKVQHAGVIIGLGGVAEHIGIGLSMNEAGYMGRAQLTQNFSAVTAACLLVRKNLFIEVGGLDEKDFAVLYNDVDLCLKIIERGYRIVWTPFATVVHHGNSSLNATPDPKRNESNLRSRKNFIKKWMSRLGNDPAYNRHLSLRERTWMIDGDFDVLWHPDLEPLPRIVAQPPDTTGVGQYRMIGPLKALTDSRRICSFLLPPINTEARFLPFPSELARVKPTVLFLQNAFSHWHIGEVENYAELLPDIFRVFGQDDIVFSVPQKSSVHKLFGKDTKARLRKAASLCHRVIATSQPIADAMRGMVDDIRVMPNYLERFRWGDLQPPRKERRKLRVGWAGAQQHQGDLEFIIPVVEATANEVDWIFMGMSLPKLRYHIAELHGPVSFDEYPAGLAALDLDLAIAPLEINRFNAAKSNLRLLEYGAVGYPVICTDIEPYRNAPVTRVPNNPQAWIDAIRAHVHDMDATRAAGEQLHDWVLSSWMLDQHLDEWMKMLLPD